VARRRAPRDRRRQHSAAPDGSPLRVVILNQYYMPDVASTGHLLHELATQLAEMGFHVEVLTSRPSYGPPETWVDCPMRETVDGVHIKRLWTTRFSKDNLLGRAINYVTFMGQLFLRVLFTSRKDTVYLYTTNPPFLGFVGAIVSLFRRHSYVMLLHDAYPQMAVWVGTIRKNGIAEKVWHFINKMSYGRAKQSIVLCQKAKSLVCDTYGIPREKVHVVPNWADSKALNIKPKPESEFATDHNLQDHFVAMYSGNLGLYYEFATLLDAAETAPRRALPPRLHRERRQAELARRRDHQTRAHQHAPAALPALRETGRLPRRVRRELRHHRPGHRGHQLPEQALHLARRGTPHPRPLRVRQRAQGPHRGAPRGRLVRAGRRRGPRDATSAP
jgi:hypothetical protein